MKKIKWWTFGYLFFVIAIIMMANQGNYKFIFQWLHIIPYGDKLGHFFLIGLLSLLINLSLNCAKFELWRMNFFKGSAIVLVIITLEEFSQVFIPSRSFDLGDVLANYVGIMFFSYLLNRIYIYPKSPVTE